MRRLSTKVLKTGPDERSTYCHHVSWLHYCFWTRFPTELYTETQVSPTITKKLIETIVWISSRKNPSHTSRFLTQFSRTGSTDPTRHEAEHQNRLQVPMSANKSVKGPAHQRHSPTSELAGRIPRRIRNTLTPFTEEKVTRKKGPRRAPTTDKDTEGRNALSKLSDSGY